MSLVRRTLTFLRTLPRGHVIAIIILILLAIYATFTSTVEGATLALVWAPGGIRSGAGVLS